MKRSSPCAKVQHRIKALALALVLSGYLLSGSLTLPARADAKTYIEAYNQGVEAQNEGEFAKSQAAWEEAIALAKTDSELATAKYNLGSLFNETGEFAKAKVQLQASLDLATKPKSQIQVRSEFYQSLLGLKELEAAEALLKTLQEAPDELLPKIRKQQLEIQLFNAQGKTAEAIAATKKMQEESPESFPGTRFTPDGKVAPLTEEDIRRNKYKPIIGDITGKTAEEVLAALRKVSKDAEAPKFKREQAKVLVGDFLLYQGKPAQAREFYLDSDLNFLGVVPKVSRLTSIADTYVAEKNWAKAIDYYDQALAVPNPIALMKSSLQYKRDVAAYYAKKK